jgi:hypothetical protein
MKNGEGRTAVSKDRAYILESALPFSDTPELDGINVHW